MNWNSKEHAIWEKWHVVIRKKRVWTSKFTTSPKRGSDGARECRFLSLFPVTRVFTGSKSQFDDQSRARVPQISNYRVYTRVLIAKATKKISFLVMRSNKNCRSRENQSICVVWKNSKVSIILSQQWQSRNENRYKVNTSQFWKCKWGGQRQLCFGCISCEG